MSPRPHGHAIIHKRLIEKITLCEFYAIFAENLAILTNSKNNHIVRTFREFFFVIMNFDFH